MGGDIVLGVDAWSKGWVGICLVDGRFSSASSASRIVDLMDGFPDAGVVAIDIPIGLPVSAPRTCDAAAAAFIGPRRSSVFATPPRSALEATTYEAALVASRQQLGVGLSRQAYALAPKILEVASVATAGDRIIEIHPEVSFRAMEGSPLLHSKTSWAGMRMRLRLLASAGIHLPEDLGAANVVGPIDLIDAAAAAWSARRYLAGEAESVTAISGQHDPGRPVTIWY